MEGFFLLKAVPRLKEKLINPSLQKHAFYAMYNTSQGQSIDNLIETCMHIAIAATKPTNVLKIDPNVKHVHSHMHACTNEMIYRRNWIISACAFRVNSRALYAYIRECAYNAVILSPTQQPDVSVMRADSLAG